MSFKYLSEAMFVPTLYSSSNWSLKDMKERSNLLTIVFPEDCLVKNRKETTVTVSQIKVKGNMATVNEETAQRGKK